MPTCKTCQVEFENRRSNRVSKFCSRECSFAFMRTKEFNRPGRPAEPLENHFWKYVSKSKGCWLWSGPMMSSGYGFIVIKGKQVGAHRISYQLNKGPIPKDHFICHACDNPRCVRPSHLFAGSPKDNTQDAVSKGRLARGSQQGSSKLTEKDVLEILRLREAGWSGPAIAKEFFVDHTLIYSILNGKSWKHVPR